ncbi:uncharacterized protein LOC131429244 [Malaya genurostris]|uniref:uncharacterized protein LOC131429244 n=1 Tax=Malaya genurostris TaxID=325434 RepID=UPI0026F3C136|nr:uncharacterized protein LOC131429244 [Malaya genurostris]
MDSDGKYVRIRKDFVAYSSDEELEQEASHNSIAESNSENCDSRSDCSETYSDHSQCPVIDSDCAGQQDSEDSRLSRDEINDPVIARTTDGESDPQTNTNTNTQKGDSDRMQQIEKILAELTKAFKHCESNMPTNRQTEHSWDFSGETSKPQNSYPNVRLEHINRFPSGIRPNQMLAEWFEFIENFEVAMSLYNANDPVYRSKLLYLSLGQELQAIVKAANLRPALIDTNCYRTFVENIENHLRSMTDTAAEHRAFLSMKQEKGESTVAFHARLVRNVKLCGYSVCDQNRFVRAQLLDGLKNKELVKAARTYGHDTNFIVQSSTRYEAYESEITQQPIDPNVFEIGRNHGYNKRSNQWIDNSQCKYRRMNQNYTQDHRSSYIDRGNSYFKQPSGLHLNTQTRGRRSRCPRKCNACGQQGHFSVTCRSKRLRPVEQRELCGEPSGDEISVDSKQNINAMSLDEALIDCSVASCKPIRFLIDSGADVNVIGGKDWLNLKRELKADSTELEIIQQSQKHLHAYASTQPMPIECIFKANVEVLGAEKPSVIALFYVVPNGIRSLLGRSTASDLKLLQVGMSVNSVKTLDHIFPKMPGVSVKFNVNQSITPTKNAYYNVPAAFREAARQRLRDMEKQGIIEKVTAAPSWISGMSAVAKGKSDFRLVVNMRAPNKAINREYFRLPLIEEMRIKLHGSKFFSKLDLSNALYHLELDEESRELTTFLAENGMYRFTRLMFGVNCAPEIFQREMTRLFIGMENVIVYIDDILVFTKSLEELRITVRKVLEILRINNLTLNNNKCEFDKERIKFLGHQLDGEGFHIDEEKIKSVRNFREPSTISELRSFLGLASFISPYIKNFADLSQPLWEATVKKTWNWGNEQKSAFQKIKNRIIYSTIALGFFSDTDKTILYTDASPNALGAVLVQEDSDCKPRIISFASKALTATERKYAQNQREALSAVWGVEHFSYFLLGRQFTLRTDAQGVTFIFNRSREESKRALTRADGWALRLSPYSYEIEYVRGRDNIADPSSRLYDGEDEPFNDDISPWEIAALEANAVNILTEQEIASATLKDETLQRVIIALETGQWSDVDERYKKVREDLSIRDGIIMKTGCAVIPTTLQNKALEISHEGHPSIAKMKSIIRQRVWWPGVAKMVQKWVESCETCAINGKPERPTPMQRMFAPKVVWETIAIDFNGPYVIFGGISILVAIDYRSRYLIARPVKSTSFESTRKVLEEIFDKEGYPKNIKPDNGPPFNGTDYREYCAERGITALFSTPLFPQQNGLVESAMKIVNKAMNAAVCDKTSYIDELRQAIHAYNAGAHSITKLPPEEIMSGRKIKRGLPLINYQRVPIDDKALDSMDRQAKLIGKHREDYRRGARKCRVKEIPQEIFSQFDAEIV